MPPEHRSTLPDAAYRTSSRSGNEGQCVEVAHTRRQVHVRDSKTRTGPNLPFDKTAFAAFIDQVKQGDHNL